MREKSRFSTNCHIRANKNNIVATMTLSLPNELKKRMDELEIINWSAVAREAFEEKIREFLLLKKIAAKSKLTEKDAIELGQRVNAGVAERHS